MKNRCNLLNINELCEIMGGLNLLSMMRHTLSPRQAGMACLGFFCAVLREARSDEKRVFAPLKGGRRKAAQRWIEKTCPVGHRPVGVPLLKGLGGSKNAPDQILNL